MEGWMYGGLDAKYVQTSAPDGCRGAVLSDLHTPTRSWVHRTTTIRWVRVPVAVWRRAK